jgi:hypothetical protein
MNNSTLTALSLKAIEARHSLDRGVENFLDELEAKLLLDSDDRIENSIEAVLAMVEEVFSAASRVIAAPAVALPMEWEGEEPDTAVSPPPPTVR